MNEPSLPVFSAEHRKSARLLYTGALGFLVAAESTHERHLYEPDTPDYWPAISVNLCFALELSLKAFIALHGAKRPVLKSIGHDLAKGLEAAQAAGYSPTHEAVTDLIKILSPMHFDHSLRYLEDRSTEIPDTRNMIAIVRHHVRDVSLQMPISDL